MKTKNKGYTLLEALVAIVIMLIIASVIGSWKCHAAWAGSGYEVSWVPVAGCRIKMSDGRVLPASSVKEVTK